MLLPFYSANETQQAFADYLRKKRKSKGFSREQLANVSLVPASTIKKFETTGQISFRQLLQLWQILDDLTALHELTKRSTEPIPKTIEQVLAMNKGKR